MIAVTTPTHLLTIERECLTITTRDNTHLLHVARFVLFDGWTPKFGFSYRGTTRLHGAGWNGNNLDRNLHNLRIVPHVSEYTHKYDESQGHQLNLLSILHYSIGEEIFYRPIV